VGEGPWLLGIIIAEWAAPFLSSVEASSELLVLARADVERLLDLDELVDALAAAFVELSAGRTSVPPRVAARTASGLLAAMPGYLPGIGLETKLVSVFPGNHPHGLPSHQALIALFDEETGRPLALMDGTYITAVRTAAASALSARLLARPEAAVLAILGAGVQGHSHLQALLRVASFHEVRVASRSADHALALASISPRARAMLSFEEAVRGADVVCCCTDSGAPILDFSWLSSGAHVTSVGANQSGPELDPETIRRGRLFVESRVAFQPPPAGAAELIGVDPGRAAELGEVIAGTAPGRRNQDEVTVYKSMGHAVEDAAAAGLVYRRAQREGAGQPVAL
jgi:ornithine cyclodeaminase/alanine dehydrogenase-like protein (mu-crystallin family)